MVAKYFINGGNTNTDLNWSLSQGGANDTTKPTSADDVFFNSSLASTVDAVLNCKDFHYGTSNTMTVNFDINVDGNYSKNAFGNMNNGGGQIFVKGNVDFQGGNQANVAINFIGDDSTLTATAGSKPDLLILNKNVGKKLTLLVDMTFSTFFADWTIEEGILDLGAFNLTGSGDLTQNGGAVTSTTGILDQERFFLNDGVFDPFKAISSTTSNSTLFTDSATLSLMPSGGDFEFKGSNHWTMGQVFTEFPHLIVNKCPTCGMGGTFYAQDVSVLNGSQWGNGFIRGDLFSDAYNAGGTVTFDGTGAQSVTGNVGFGRLKFNKISGSLKFNDDFRLQECEVVAGANLVDFGTTLAHIFDPLDHLQFWSVAGLKFYSIKLEIATTGSATMNNTTILNNLDITQAGSLSGNIVLGGNFSNNDGALSGGIEAILNGDGDQTLFTTATSSGVKNSIIVTKNSGIVKQLSNIGDSLIDISIVKGVWCTNEFDLTADDLSITDSQAELQKTTNSNVTYNTLVGTITNTDSCKKKTNFFAVI